MGHAMMPASLQGLQRTPDVEGFFAQHPNETGPELEKKTKWGN
jgi:hypothetical protein